MPGPGRLTLADWEEITLGLHADDLFTAIAARLGKAVSTVSRMAVGPQQFWLGPGRTGQQVRFWIDTVTVHLSSTGGESGPCRPG